MTTADMFKTAVSYMMGIALYNFLKSAVTYIMDIVEDRRKT